MDWKEYFENNPVSKSDTGREQITYIPLTQLDSDEKNFYSLSEIPQLADNIATVGLQQPIRVRKHPEQPGRFLIVSGHRRRAALELLAQDDPAKWAEVACIVQADSVSPALQQLQLIYANAATRKLSSADMSEQAAQVEKLLYQLQEEGHEFPGRMRDHVAQVMQTTNTKLAQLKRIREHLHEVWQPRYKDGTIKESAAYELSKQDPSSQKLIYDVLYSLKRELRFEYADDFKQYAARMEDVCTGECASCDKDCRDIALYSKKCKSISLARYAIFRCDRCCSSCDDLASCKYACPAFSDEIAAIKAAKKEDAQRIAADQEARERPVIDLLKLLWERFGEARRASGYSVADAYAAIDKFFGTSTEQNVLALESGEAKFSAYSTEIPGGESYTVSYVKRLRAMADLFGVTTDFLLGRTVPEVSDFLVKNYVPSENSPLPGAWYPASVEPPMGVTLVLIDSDGIADTGKYTGCGEYTMDYGDPVVLWSVFPDTDTVNEFPPNPIGWQTGVPACSGTYAAYVKVEGVEKLMLKELFWNGEWWSMLNSRLPEETSVVCWAERPYV